MLVFLSIPFKRIISDVFCFYLWLIQSMTKLSSLFLVMPVKENNNHASNWLTFLSRNLSSYLLSLYTVAKYEYSKYFPSQLITCTVVSLYLILIFQRQENQIYFESLFMINLQWLLFFNLVMCEEPCAFILACFSGWSELGLINF